VQLNTTGSHDGGELSAAWMAWLPTRPRPQVVKVGIVGGSDLVKIQEQLGDNGT
jgi:hypothetical protein